MPSNCPTATHETKAAGIAVDWGHTLPSDVERTAQVTLTNLTTGAQTNFTATDRLHQCLSLDAGVYRVSLISPGLKPYRGLVEARAGEVARLSPLLEPHDAERPTLQAVLANLGVTEPHGEPRDLDVPARTTVILDSSHPAYARDWKTVQIADVDAAKIIGVADADWGVDAPRYGPLSAQDLSNPAALARATAREYIYGHSPSAAQWRDHINRHVFAETWSFFAFILGTVTINAGAVLVLNDASSFFICRKLRMHVTGTLRITGRGPGVIQPLAYKSFC